MSSGKRGSPGSGTKKACCMVSEILEEAGIDVRVMALDGFATYGPEVALETLVGRVLDPNEAMGVKTVVFEQLVESGWSLEPWRAQLDAAGVLPSFYRVGKQGRLERA